MLFSFNKLKKLSNAPYDWTVENMVEALNQLGFEVESYKKFTNIEGIKFGKIKKVIKHHDADKLFICETEFHDKTRTIITSSKNVQENKYVVAFPPGSKSKNVVFGSKTFKGVTSEGMFGSLTEFGVDNNVIPEYWSDGIWILEKADLNSDPIKVFDLDDYIIEVDLLSNRSDANSYWVMAQELAAFLNNPIKVFKDIKASIGNTDLKINKNDSKDLLSLSECKTENINISIEDIFLLMKTGIKPTIKIDDLKNLTFIMTGQPVIAYDKNLIGKNFSIKNTVAEKIKLNKEDIKLENSLLIYSDDKPVSAAGIIVFDNAQINTETQNIIIEVSNFNIKLVRNAAKQIKVDSLTSRQSAKQLGVGTQEFAWAFLSNKINSISKIIGMPKNRLKQIIFSKKELIKVMGKDIEDKKYKEIIAKLEILGFHFKDNNVSIPTYRHDIESQQDMNEEFIRLYGYNNLTLKAPMMISPSHVKQIRHKHLKAASMGYQEVRTYSLVSQQKNLINPFAFKNTIKLKKFVSKEREFIRNSMAISLLEIIKYNQKRKMEDINIFDIGQINNGVLVLGLSSTTKTFNEMKNDIMNIISKPNIIFERTKDENLHSGISAIMKYNNEIIGWIGKVHPKINLPQAFVAEIKLKQTKNKLKSFIPYKDDQMKIRDFTFELKKKEDISSKIEDIKNNVFSIKVLDTFEKEDIRKVTIRVIGNDEDIQALDEKFNFN